MKAKQIEFSTRWKTASGFFHAMKNATMQGLTPFLAMAVLLFAAISASGAYSGSGTFVKITSLADLADGYYVIARSTGTPAMTHTNAGTFFTTNTISPIADTLTNPSGAIVWLIQTNATYGGHTILNEASNRFASYSGSANAVYAVGAVNGTTGVWSFSYASGVFTVANKAAPTRVLQYNASTPRFACYTSAQQKFALYKMEVAATPAITLSDNGTQVGTASVAAGASAHVLHKFSTAVATANATLNTVAFTTAGTYQTADITNLKLRYSTDATLDGGDATLGTITGPAAAGAKSFTGLSQAINLGATGYFFITMDVAASPTGGRTISVNAIGTGDLTFAAGTKSGSTTAGGAQTLQAATTPTIAVSAGTLAFGNVQQNGTSSELTYTVSGANLTANIVLAPPAGFEISTTSGSGFVANPSTLTLTPSGGTVSSTTIYARFKPTAITAYSANIAHTSTGATTQNKAATGTGIVSSSSDIVRDAGFTEPSNIAYGSYQEANLTAASLQVGSFTIRDGGSSADSDSVGTTLSAITFNVANSASVRRIALYDGSTELGEVAGGATATFGSLSVAAADGGTQTLTVRASFNASVTDNQQVSFTVASATATAAGSGFAAANAGGAASDTTGDRNRIEVTATKLVFSAGPAAGVGVNEDFAATVQARDANENVDVDSTASVTMSRTSGSGTLSSVVGLVRSLVAGVGTWSDLRMDTGGTFTIQAAAVGLTSATSGSVTACPLPAPTVQAASGIGTTSLFANWSAVPGASGYRLDVSTNASFSGGVAGGLLISQYIETDSGSTPKGIEVWNATGADITFNATDKLLDVKVGVNGAAPSSVCQIDTGTLAAGEGWVIGTADMSPDEEVSFTFNGDDSIVLELGGVVQDVFGNPGSDPGTAWSGGGVSTANRNIQLKTGITAGDTDGWTDPSARFEDVASGSTLTGFGTAPTGGGSGSSYLLGFADLDVGNVTTYEVGGLTDGATYYYRVRASNGVCGVSVNSATQSVTTVAGTAAVALDDNGTQVAAGSVIAGTLNCVLHQFELAVTDSTAVLTGLAFETDGTYAAADVQNFKAWYSANATLETGSDTLLGTISAALGPGAKSLTGLSQAIAVGTTGYVFLTVDVAAAPTYGRTVFVDAVATGDLTFLAATKSGSTTAGGAQTIVPIEPTTHASSLVFSSVQQAQMTLAWTSGGGGRRIVVAHAGGATSWTPTDGVGPSGVNADFSAATDQGSGNKIVYDDTGAGFTATGLDTGTTYFFTVFEYNGSGAWANYYVAGTPLSGSQTTACQSPPATLWANPTNTSDFTARWSAVAGATGYRIDVSTTAFGASGTTRFQGFEGEAGDTWTFTTNSGSVAPTTTRDRTGSYSLRFNGAGSVTFDPVALSGSSASTVTVAFSASGADSGDDLYLAVYTRVGGVLSSNTIKLVDGSSNAEIAFGATSGLTVSPNPYSVAISAAATQVFVVVYALGLSSSEYYYIDDLSLMGPTAAFVPGFENLAVAGTSVWVDGLFQNTMYYWRVRTEGPGCTSDSSATASVTTLSGPLLLEYVVEDALAVPNQVTDGALRGGGVEIGFTYFHATGMKLAGSTYQVLAPDGTVVVASRPFDAIASAMVGGTNAQILTATVPGIDPAVLGVYTARVEVVSSNDMTATGSGAFTVVDDDVAVPVHGGFNVAGAVFQTNQMVGGLVVTGWVADASGVFAGTSNAWSLASNGTLIASGSMAMLPNVNGAGTTGLPAALSVTIATNFLTPDDTIAYVFSVVSTDTDVDRPGDSLSTSNAYCFQVIPQAPEAPIGVTATVDGAELVDLVWNKNGAPNVLVLWSTNAVADAPTQGQAYAAGDSVGDSKVVYKGSANGLERVVPPGVSHYFRLYGAAGNTYSTTAAEPSTTPVTTLAYEEGEIIDQFVYTNGITLAAGAIATGQGWDGLWTGDLADWSIENGSLSEGSSGFPDPYANRIVWDDTSAAAADSSVIVRKLASPRSGKTFVSFMLNYESGGTGKSAGLWLASGVGAGTEELFFGKVAGQTNKAGIFNPDGAVTTASSVSLTPGADSMIVGEFDSGQKTVRIWAFAGTDSIPQDYTNATPSATYSNASLSVAALTGIRLEAESDDTGALGEVRFDEVRLANTWDEVLNFNFPKAFNFSAGIQINGTNVVTDGQLSEIGKSYPISYQLYHRTGVTNAQFTIVTNVNSLSGLYASPIDLQLNPAHAGSVYRAFTNKVDVRLDTNDVTLGVYTSRVWMTAVSGKTTNTLFMEGQAGASDLFFGEFGEGNNFDKYVEIYNGSGGAIDLSQYVMANQKNPTGAETNDYTILGWASFCRLASSPTLLGHGETMLILNGAPSGKIDPSMTNALQNAVPPRPYLITTNEVLTVSGDDPVALFRVTDTNQWIDACGIGPSAARYVMRRLENAEVPRSYPLTVDPGQWDYRVWDGDRPTGYTNLLATAGVYDRNVGLGGYITFAVVDDDVLPPAMGTNNVLRVGTGPYTSLAPSNGSVEVVLTAWNFNGDNPTESAKTWTGSLVTNGTITCHPNYTPGPVDDTDGGTSENDLFGVYDQPNDGVAEFASIGTYFTQGDTAWIQYEIDLTSAEDMVLSWAENSGSDGFNTAQLLWSSDGVSFITNAAWPSWDPSQGNLYQTHFAEFDGVVTPGLSKVYVRVNLGPGYGGASGFYRMDNVQLTGYPQEFLVTDGQIAASGNKLQFQANLYDTNSGLDKAQATMSLQSKAGTRVPGNDLGDGTNSTDTLWWELALTGGDVTDYVNASLTGSGLSIDVVAPDRDADRPDDVAWLNGRIGHVRVTDDDSRRPHLSLTSMKPLSSILAQWAQLTDTNTFLPTKSDASVEAAALQTQSSTADPKSPLFSRLPTNGSHYVEAWAWQGQQKCWLIEVTPEADMAVTNLTFTSYLHRTNGVSHYRIDHYVDGALVNNILPNTYWVDPPALLDPTVWYTRSHGWATNAVVLQAGKKNQIRIYGLGSSNIGARWRLSELTLWQATLSSNGVTEVTDAEFTDGSFMLEGNAWDSDSGIASTNHSTPSKRPSFSLNSPDGGVLVSNRLFDFTGAVADGGATTKGAGAFEGSLPTPVYTNVMLGTYTGEAHVWDFDNDRTSDDLRLRGDLALYVVDNDIREPTAVDGVRVNGTLVGTAPDRDGAVWTNQPGFIVSLDTLAVDQDPGAAYSAKQRGVAGIGEYRVATNANINSLSASNRASLGTPYPVAATAGALANYGFERIGQGWTLDANSSYRSLVLGGTNDVKEGTNSLRQVNGGVAYQTIEFRNTAGTAPVVGVGGWYRSDTAGGPTFRIEAFATNNLVTPVATRDIQPGTATAWTAFTGAPAALGDGTVEVLKISLIDGGGNTTFWDALRLSVDVGANTSAMRFTAGKSNQGLAPQYLFAVDADNNRAGDPLAGAAVPFYVAYDATPPTAVPMLINGASTLTVEDPTSQFDLMWDSANVGPDDPAHALHPTGLGSDRDTLSPWKSYKIYYQAHTPPESPAADYIYTNYISNGVYQTWPSVTADTPNYSALSQVTNNQIRLSGLEFDQEYVVVVVGLDRAGNEGPASASSWATNNTIRFSMNRGLILPKSEIEEAFPSGTSLSNSSAQTVAALYWNAAGLINTEGTYTAVTRTYDLIYWDSSTFQEQSNNNWRLVGTVQTNWFVDDGGLGRGRGQIRFYRASYTDRWKRTNTLGQAQRSLASEEVYALHNVVLSGGENYVALHGLPSSNSFAGVLGGLESFPGGSSALPLGGATVVEFFEPGVNTLTSDQYYLNTDGRWTQVNGGDVTDVLQTSNFFTRGFSIRLPKPLPAPYATTTAVDKTQLDTNGLPSQVPAMMWSPIVQVPTNGFSQVIQTGSRTGMVSTRVYNLAALRLPISAHPSEMNLIGSGFVKGAPGWSDEIYTMDTSTKSVLNRSTIYCDASGVWRFVSGNGLVPAGFFKPNDVLVIVSRNQVGSGSWTWTYHPSQFYSLPTRWMQPNP